MRAGGLAMILTIGLTAPGFAVPEEPIPGWMATGDLLLRAGHAVDALDAYLEEARGGGAAGLHRRLALAFVMDRELKSLALPHALRAAREDSQDRGSRELIAWLSKSSDEARRAAEEAKRLVPRDDLERAAALLGAAGRGGPLVEILESWPAPSREMQPLHTAPRVNLLRVLMPRHSPDRHSIPEKLPPMEQLEQGKPVNWAARQLMREPALTMSSGGSDRFMVFHLAAESLLQRQNIREAQDLARAGFREPLDSSASNLAMVLARTYRESILDYTYWLLQTLELDPLHLGALSEIASLLSRRGEPLAAARLLLTGVERYPANRELLDALAEAYSQTTERKEALAWASRSAATRPPRGHRWAVLAERLEQAGHPARAKAARGRAVLSACKDHVRKVHKSGVRRGFTLGIDRELPALLAFQCESIADSLLEDRTGWRPSNLDRLGSWIAGPAALALARSRFRGGKFQDVLTQVRRARATPLAELGYGSTLCDASLIEAAALQQLGRHQEADRSLERALKESFYEGRPLVLRSRREVARYRRLLREGGSPPPLSVEVRGGLELKELNEDATLAEIGEASLELAALLLATDRAGEALGILREPRAHGARSLLLRSQAEWMAGSAELAAVALLAAIGQGLPLELARSQGEGLLSHLASPVTSRPAGLPVRKNSHGESGWAPALEWLSRGEPFEAARCLSGMADGYERGNGRAMSRAWERLAELRRRKKLHVGATRALRMAAASSIQGGQLARARALCGQAWAPPEILLARLRSQFGPPTTVMPRGGRSGAAALVALLLALGALTASRLLFTRLPEI